MKYIKLFMLMAVVSLFTACSDEDSYNTSSVVVEFESAEQAYRESDNYVKVPVKFTGERNGDIKLKIEAVAGTAEEDVHYMVTSDEINLPKDSEDEVVYVEVRLIDDGQEENDDRVFTLNIVDVKGAELGDNKSCAITVKDVDKNPYFKLFGTYEVEAVDAQTGNPISFEMTIDDDQDTESAEKYLYGHFVPEGWDGFESAVVFKYKPNGTLQVGTFADGDWDGLYNFGAFKGAVAVLPFDIIENGIYPCEEGKGPMAVYNDTFDTIEFVDDCLLTTAVWSYDGGFKDYKGYYDDPIFVLKLTKK